MLRTLTFCLLLVGFGAGQASAQIIFTGGTYSQNFNTLASSGSSNPWVDNVTIPGWYSTRISYEASDGTGSTANFYSYGGGTTNPITERALGSITSNPTPVIIYGVQILNATGSTINSFDLAYFGEQWRNSGGQTGNSLVFSYLVTSTPGDQLTVLGYVDFAPLNFNSISVGPPATALDGNAAANRTLISGTVPNLGWDTGEFLWLRWNDTRLMGTPNNGLAIDDLSFTAVPEVGPIALVLVLGAGAFAFRNLRRKTPETAEGEVAVADPASLEAPTAGEVCPVVIV